MRKLSKSSLHAQVLRNVKSLQNSPYDNCVTAKLSTKEVSSVQRSTDDSFARELINIAQVSKVANH